MRVLVTGSNGFVGKEIIAELIRNEIDPVGLDRDPGIDPSISHIQADIALESEIEKIGVAEGIDAVIHSAGLAHQFGPVAREKFWAVNVTGTSNVARAAALMGAKHFVLVSSVSVYGKAEDGAIRDESASCEPEGDYAQSKYESELEAQKVCSENGIGLTILRLATVIGEGDRGNVGRLIEAIDMKRFIWIGKGENRKSLIYKKDVARACVAAVQKPHSGSARVFNVSAESLKMSEIASAIEVALGKKTLPGHVPAGLLRAAFAVNKKTVAIGKVEKISNTIEKWLSDETFPADKIKQELGFETATSVKEAIRLETGHYLKCK